MKRTILIVLSLIVISLAVLFTGKSKTSNESAVYNQIDNIEISGAVVDVEITGGSSKTVELELIDIPKKYTVSHKKNGSVLKILAKSKPLSFSLSNNSRMILSVPESVNIYIENSTGNITVSNIDGNDFSVTSSTGDIKLENINCDAYAKSTTGDIEFIDINGDITAKSSTGSIELTDISGNITAESSTGNQTYNNIEGNIKAESTTGKKVLKDVSGILYLESSTGRIDGDNINLTDDSYFKTSTGDINLDLNNDMDDFSFNMNSSTGDISIGDSEARGTLKFGSGPILVTGKSSTGDQTYK